MTGIKHKKVAQGSGNGDPTQVQPIDWNEEHEVPGLLAKLLLLAEQPNSVAYLGANAVPAYAAVKAYGLSLLSLENLDALRAAIGTSLAGLGGVAKAGDTMAGDLSLGLYKITNLGVPVAASDAARKADVDAVAALVSGSLIFKGGWDAATGAFPAGAEEGEFAQLGWFYLVTGAGTVDGIAFAEGDFLYATVDDASVTTYEANWLHRSSELTRTVIESIVGFSFGSLAAASSVNLGQISGLSANVLSVLGAADYAAIRTLLSIGSAALKNSGTAAGNVVVLDENAKLPAVDGSQLTNVQSPTGWSTGDVKLTFKSAPDDGWIMMNDGTIGDAASGATNRANADVADLYAVMWAIPDTWAPVTGGRGASAAADFAAHKPLRLTKALGRAIAIAGAGAGLTARALGQALGEETHAQTLGELANHAHSGGASIAATRSVQLVEGGATADDVTIGNTGAAGGGAAMNVMQPTSFYNAMVKL